MTETRQNPAELKALVEQRLALEEKVQNETGELSRDVSSEYERAYTRLQNSLAHLFKSARDDSERITIMLEMMRILENRLVYLQNFIIDPTGDNKILAQLVTRFIDEVSESARGVISPLEGLYYRAVAALYAGDVAKARDGFNAACASEESDEANDIKYKSYVILGNLSHVESDFRQARQLHDDSIKYSHNNNVTAQALAFKALNAFALKDEDEALDLFEQALTLFDRNAPFFNSYFHRNSLLFCGSIHYSRKQYDQAESYYRQVLDVVEHQSYDYFDALSQLGRVCYSTGRFDDAAENFRRAIETHKFSENEYLVDTYYWLARTHLKRNDSTAARPYLEKINSSDVKYDKRAQVEELLRQV
ncbi:MAG TPA: tetratricopeptide repeat protein [Thermoanaerobaculia bacterium]|nr:tetratricopeptide repeat protein [Thermoanaerobaculia bacterium]